jgi:beta-lactamase regulating signal transducer with metallopeptidase domain
MHELFPIFVTQIWQVTLLAIFVWIVTKTCCKRRPHLGHALWLLVLIKCVVPPVFGSSASVYSWLMTHDNPNVVADQFVEATPQTADAHSAFPKPKILIAKPAETAPVVPIVNPAFQTPPSIVTVKQGTPTIVEPVGSVQRIVAKSKTPQAVAIPVVNSIRTARSVPARAMSPTPVGYSWIIKAWLLGAAMFFAATVLRYLRFRSWINRQTEVEATDIESQVLTLAKKLRLRRKIRVNVVDAEFGPAVVGLVRPMIVLPNSIVAGNTAEELEPILGHELIHLRRGDIYWSVLQVVACSLMWFHPLVWLASRNVTRETEKCCDEETIANFQCDRANYARVLVDILEQKSRLRIAPVAPGVRPTDITSSRLERIMNSDNGTCRRTPRWIWALTLLIAIVVLPGAAIVQSQQIENGFSLNDTEGSPALANGSFQSDDARWRLSGDTKPPVKKTVILAPNQEFSPSPSQAFGGGFGQFNTGAAKAKFEARILEMANGDEEQKKILKELEDKFWQSSTTRRKLQNCKIPQVYLEMRFAKVPESFGNEILKKTKLEKPVSQNRWKYSEHQISKSALKELLVQIHDSDESEVSSPSFQTVYLKSPFKTPDAEIYESFVSGLENVSIVDPANFTPRKTRHSEGVFLVGKFDDGNKESVPFSGNINIRKLQRSAGRKLPLKLGANEVKIENPLSKTVQHPCSWDLLVDQVRVIRASFEDDTETQILVFVEATRKPAFVSQDEDLTLERVIKIKDELSAKTAHGNSVFSEYLPEPESAMSTKTPKPLALVLKCGETDQKRSLNTKIGLVNNATLTVEGEVESQQISVNNVQVSGNNFVFKNVEEGLFHAQAAKGSLSFNRGEFLEKTLRLSLKSNATLQFAGVEFAADSIECFPDRIEANGSVNVSIPEISSKVSAGRVIMNLKSLAFDFDGDVKVERNVGGDSFPFLVKGNHVAWSLITGEMQTDVRYSSPNRSAGNRGSFGARTFGGSGSTSTGGFGPSTGFTMPSGNRIGQVPPKRSARNQGTYAQPKTQNSFDYGGK